MSTTAYEMRAAIDKTWGTMGKRAQYVIAYEVHNGAGFGYNRSLDAVVFDTWPSKGLTLHGLEIKVTAADMRRELLDTTKAGAFTEYVDWFSIVAPKGVVDIGLLPKKWGVYELTEAGGLRARRKPLMLHDGRRDQLDRSFLAAFCRALVDRSRSTETMRQEYERGRKDGQDYHAFSLKSTQDQLQDLAGQVAAFKQASGIDINRYVDGAELGRVVAAVRKGGWSNPHNLKSMHSHAQTIIEEVAALEAIWPKVAREEEA